SKVAPAAIADHSPLRVTLEKLLAFAEAPQRVSSLAELRQHPGGHRNRPWKQASNISSSDDRNPMIYQRPCLCPVTLEDMQNACGEVSHADCVGVMRLLGQLNHLSFVLGRLGESPKVGEAEDEPMAIVDCCRLGGPEIFMGPGCGQCL